MAPSRDQKELLWAWQGWPDAMGPQLQITFECYVQLSNKAAKLSGYKDMGALWWSKHEPDTLEGDLEQLFQELQLLYPNPHACVRQALHRHCGPVLINPEAPSLPTSWAKPDDCRAWEGRRGL
ncbi:Angiotensin-Converting Enzyme [Manis pentadactyla]|nr:Angiotensin-Converting Enzyme [Manis pentadactyla]